jgi:hypothetical protein
VDSHVINSGHKTMCFRNQTAAADAVVRNQPIETDGGRCDQQTQPSVRAVDGIRCDGLAFVLPDWGFRLSCEACINRTIGRAIGQDDCRRSMREGGMSFGYGDYGR